MKNKIYILISALLWQYTTTTVFCQQPLCHALDVRDYGVTVPDVPSSPGGAGLSLENHCMKAWILVTWESVLDLGSRQSAINWASYKMRQTDTLFAREGVNFTWEIEVPYGPTWIDSVSYSNVTSLLFDMSLRYGPWEQGANLIGVIGTDPFGGGVAWIDGLCIDVRRYDQNGPICDIGPYFVAMSMQPNTKPLSANRWDEKLIPHEIGHNIGLHHTFDCVWGPNRDMRIDTLPNAYVCDFIVPVQQGSIMSYCQFWNVCDLLGVGFGTHPGARMRDKINAALCLDYQPSITIGGIFEGQYIADQVTITNGGNPPVRNTLILSNETVIEGPTEVFPQFTISTHSCDN